MSKKRIGVFEAGPVPDEVIDQYPNYAQMIINWLQPSLPDVDFIAYSPIRNEPLPAIDACDGYIYSGSRYGAYDDIAWIPALEAFIRQQMDQQRAQFGICFGHQIMAQALGGRVVKSDKGWGCGVQQYKIDAPALTGNSGDGPREVNVLVMHQDQVVDLPSDANAIGGNQFCPFGVIEYKQAALSSQFHPEFSNAYVSDLLRLRGGVIIDQAVADRASETLSQVPDNPLVAQWVARFFHEHW